jgi:hypothetical protein
LSTWNTTINATIHTSTDTKWFNILDAASTRCRRRCSRNADESSPVRPERTRHGPDSRRTARSARCRTIRRSMTPDKRVSNHAETTTTAAISHCSIAAVCQNQPCRRGQSVLVDDRHAQRHDGAALRPIGPEADRGKVICRCRFDADRAGQLGRHECPHDR